MHTTWMHTTGPEGEGHKQWIVLFSSSKHVLYKRIFYYCKTCTNFLTLLDNKDFLLMRNSQDHCLLRKVKILVGSLKSWNKVRQNRNAITDFKWRIICSPWSHSGLDKTIQWGSSLNPKQVRFNPKLSILEGTSVALQTKRWGINSKI